MDTKEDEIIDDFILKHTLNSIEKFPKEKGEKILHSLGEVCSTISLSGIVEIGQYVRAVREATEISNAAENFCLVLTDSNGKDLKIEDITKDMFANACIMGFLSSMLEVHHLREVALEGLKGEKHFRDLLELVCKEELERGED